MLIRYTLDRVRIDVPELTACDSRSIPENPTMDKIPAAIAKAHELYVKQHPSSSLQVVVMMVIHDGETNSVDQRWLEYALWDK